jgi:hypothetical protein
MLASAGVARGKTVTSPITARTPDDLPAFCREIVNALAKR